jgi:ribosome biogenesis GTPase A
MTKTRRMIETDIKLVDAVAEITDARCPEASRNPILDELIRDKPRVMILNKSDYADEKITKDWKSYYEKQDCAVLICDCRSGKGVSYFVPLLKKKLAHIIEKRNARGMKGLSLRVMVVGIPNVGKSSFINRMANSRKVKVSDKPGVTRGKQWVTIDKEIELLDTPGILWHKFDDPEVAKKLAFTGAVKDEVMDGTELALEFISLHTAQVEARFNAQTLEEIAHNRKMLASGGVPDIERAAIAVLDEFRAGKLGRISLEKPT